MAEIDHCAAHGFKQPITTRSRARSIGYQAARLADRGPGIAQGITEGVGHRVAATGIGYAISHTVDGVADLLDRAFERITQASGITDVLGGVLYQGDDRNQSVTGFPGHRPQRTAGGGGAQGVAEHGDLLANAIEHRCDPSHHATRHRNAAGSGGQFAADIGNAITHILHHTAHGGSGYTQPVRIGAQFAHAIGHAVTQRGHHIAGRIGHALHHTAGYRNRTQGVADLPHAIAKATDRGADILNQRGGHQRRSGGRGRSSRTA
ncbi:hypothetical protein D3C73_892480 [compost metagenome]